MDSGRIAALTKMPVSMTIRLAKLMHQRVHVGIAQGGGVGRWKRRHLPPVVRVPPGRLFTPLAHVRQLAHVVPRDDIGHDSTTARDFNRFALGTVDQFTEAALRFDRGHSNHNEILGIAKMASWGFYTGAAKYAHFLSLAGAGRLWCEQK